MTAELIQLVPAEADLPVPIINLPHLLSIRQRLGALAFSLACWLYFLVPVAVLGAWLAGFGHLAEEVVMLGGWRRFQHLMQESGKTLLILLGVWLAWSAYLLVARRRTVVERPVVDDAMLCGFFGIDPSELERYRGARLLTIHFEDDGRYRQLVPEDAAVELVTAAHLEASGTAFPLARTG